MEGGRATLAPDNIGECMASLYLSLQARVPGDSGGPDLYAVADALQACEVHILNNEHNETTEVVTEIVMDCRKKAVPVLRSPFVEVVRLAISSTRKKLIAKTNNNIDSDVAYKHGERHFYLLTELLGGWSNSVMQVSSLGLSLPTFHAVVLPLHSRVVDCAVECFAQFKKDKKLDLWHERVMNAHPISSATSSSSSGGTMGSACAMNNNPTANTSGGYTNVTDFSIVTLDSIVAQVAAMREVVGKYYGFLDNFSYPGYDTASGTTPTMTVYPAEELRQWRELDMIYISLESGYLSHALGEALREERLVEVQTGIYVPQLIEDVFFIFSRVLDRSVSTCVDSILLAIAMKLVMYIDFDPLAGEEDEGRPIYRVLSSKHRFLGSYRKQAISSSVMSPGSTKSATGTSPSSSRTPIAKGVPTAQALIKKVPTSSSRENLKAVVGEELGEELGALAELTGLNKLVSTAGQSSWFAVLSSAAAGITDSPPITTNALKGVAGSSGTSGAKGSHSNLFDALIAGVEEDAGAEPYTPAKTEDVESLLESLPLSSSNGQPSSGNGTKVTTAPAVELELELDPLLFYDQYHYNRDGSYRTMMSVISTVAEVVASDDVVSYERLYCIPNSAEDVAAYANPHSLSLTDWAVSFNACTAATSSITNLHRTYEAYFAELPPASASYRTLDMICSELRRVCTLHAQLVDTDMTALFWEAFEKHIAQPVSLHTRARTNVKNEIIKGHSPVVSLNKDDNQCKSEESPPRYCMTYTSVNYEVDGDTMEKCSKGSEIVRVVSNFIYNCAYEDQVGGADKFSGGGAGAPEKYGVVALYSSAEDGADSEKKADERGHVSVLSHHLRPYCSSGTFSAVVNMFASFFSRHLLYEALLTMQFSEWGALLFQTEVYAVVHIFEGALNQACADDASGGATAIPQSPGCVSSDNNGVGSNTVRSHFPLLLWVLKLLCLDRVGDVGRYRIPLQAFEAHKTDLCDILAAQEKRTGVGVPGTTVAERFVRAVLLRRRGFTLDAVTKARLTFI